MSRLFLRSAAGVLVLGVLLAGILEACGSTSEGTAPHSSSPTTQPAAATTPVSLPAGYGNAAALAVDPIRPGVWFLSAASPTDVAVFFWNAQTQVVRTYPLPDPEQHGMDFGLYAGLAATPTGTVWVGTGRTLAGIDERTGAVTYETPPQPEPVSLLAAIESIAVGPGGELAIAYNESPSVEVRSASGSYTTLTLPGGLLASATAYLQDGTLGVAATVATGEAYGTVDFFAADGAVSSVAAPSWGISAAGDRFLTSMQDVVFVSPPKAGQPAQVEPAIRQAQLPGNIVLQLGAGAQVAGSWVLASTRTGFVEVNQATGSIRTLTLPTTSCDGMIGPGPAPPPSPGSTAATTSRPCTIAESPTNFIVVVCI